jgi:metal-responsive CopG/Arc/MetJ family transcriptional regulator
MRATLNIPNDLLDKVQKITGEKSKTKAITTAMKEFVRQKKIKELIALRGKIHIDYDWEKEEEREMEAQKKREAILERKKQQRTG